MSDYIKRKDAIKEVGEYIYRSQRRDIQPTDFDTTYILLHLPSADVAPVRHGRWELDEETDSFFCSECNSEALLKAVVIGGCLQELSEYCPNCGARMDGDSNEID